MSTETDPATLISRMLRKELFVILNEPATDMDRFRELLGAHLAYMIDLEKRGVLFASGPLSAADGVMTGLGLTIVRAGSFEEAEAIAAADPFAKAGVRRGNVRRWIVNEGRIELRVDFSDRGGDLR